ncbi:MAG: ABC transporter ATP-binding protein [Kiritimatiellaeota bacterium]|nr:ABC transporter ATP-binding protein [Kiritimatiellota bacterium]
MTTTRPRPGATVIVSNVSKSFSASEHASRSQPSFLSVIMDLSLELANGSSLALTGPSGSGKTTLLNLIGTLLAPDSGTITIDGIDTAGLSGGNLARFRNERIGFLFQEHNLLPQCDVIENILVPTVAFHPASKTEKMERAMELLSIVGLSDATRAFPENLSGGEKQRVALVRALINDPTLLLADEPTGSLDTASARKLTDLMFDLNRSKAVTLVIATHSTQLANEAVLRLEMGNT